jgi:hypothetical protein
MRCSAIPGMVRGYHDLAGMPHRELLMPHQQDAWSDACQHQWRINSEAVLEGMGIGVGRSSPPGRAQRRPPAWIWRTHYS